MKILILYDIITLLNKIERMCFKLKEVWTNKTRVHIYTDGACRGNGKDENIGGYGIILMYKDMKKEIKRAFKNVTNNKMELLSAINALKMLKEPCEVKLYSDSQYLVRAFNEGWIVEWKKNNWKRKEGELKNADLWKELDKLNSVHKITWIWVKGHADNEYNNRCDKLANEAMDELIKEEKEEE